MLLQQKLHNVAAVHVDRIEPGAAVALELLLRDDGRGSGDEERRHQVQVARPPTAGRGAHRPWRHPAISLLKAAKLLPLHSCSRPASLGGTRLRQLARHKTAPAGGLLDSTPDVKVKCAYVGRRRVQPTRGDGRGGAARQRR
jgi:hypothetical protein